MKLTYVLIIAVLFLTACQLITADDSRDEKESRAVDGMQNSEGSRSCANQGEGCQIRPCCGDLKCYGPSAGKYCKTS
nr:TPA_inf: conotoxin precursor O1 [Conus ebraeus]